MSILFSVHLLDHDIKTFSISVIVITKQSIAAFEKYGPKLIIEQRTKSLRGLIKFISVLLLLLLIYFLW